MMVSGEYEYAQAEGANLSSDEIGNREPPFRCTGLSHDFNTQYQKQIFLNSSITKE